MSRGKKSSISSSFSIGLIAIGSLFLFAGGFCTLYYYPKDCSFSSDGLLCSPRQVLLLMAIITCFSSGASMMIFGLITLCCTSNKMEKEFKAPHSTKDPRAIKPCKKKPISTIHVFTEEQFIVVKENGPQIFHNNPPFHYKEQNLVLGSEILSNGTVKHIE
ncbi:uncharacterized protein [Palaemon carinicauda]|uniref:uncharacterized protein n=1 Tax=Palaemon carinicauda TaxID=392227 RepID=UPI0035B588CE